MYKSAATILSRTTLHLKLVTPTLSNVIYSERDDCDSAIDISVIGFKCISHVEGNNQGTLASQMVSMSPLLPTKTTAWFALLKRQLEAVRITDNKHKVRDASQMPQRPTATGRRIPYEPPQTWDAMKN